MTNMQLAYTEYLENARHNRAQEQLTSSDISEKVRHNIKSEELSEAEQQLKKYMNDSSLLNAKEVAAMNANARIAVQELKNQISEKQIAQKQQEINNAYEKYQHEMKKIDADATLSKEKALSEKQKRQADLKAQLLAAVSTKGKALGSKVVNFAKQNPETIVKTIVASEPTGVGKMAVSDYEYLKSHGYLQGDKGHQR